MKMYILVLDSVPLGFAIVGVAHAAAAAILKWLNPLSESPDPTMIEWLTSFKKVVCKVTAQQLQEAKELAPDHIVLTESALNGEIVSVVFKPRAEWPEQFKKYRLYVK